MFLLFLSLPQEVLFGYLISKIRDDSCGSRLRRELAVVMGIRHALDKLRYDNTGDNSHTMTDTCVRRGEGHADHQDR